MIKYYYVVLGQRVLFYVEDTEAPNTLFFSFLYEPRKVMEGEIDEANHEGKYTPVLCNLHRIIFYT